MRVKAQNGWTINFEVDCISSSRPCNQDQVPSPMTLGTMSGGIGSELVWLVWLEMNVL
jgi:hypothetical protein